MIVLDASVLLQWFLEEEDRSAALKFYHRHLQGIDLIAVPELAFYEVGNALVTRTTLSAVEIEDYLTQLLACELERAQFSDLRGLTPLARQHGLTVYDASYVALAHALRCPLITADERLLARLKGVPRIFHLRELGK